MKFLLCIDNFAGVTYIIIEEGHMDRQMDRTDTAQLQLYFTCPYFNKYIWAL